MLSPQRYLFGSRIFDLKKRNFLLNWSMVGRQSEWLFTIGWLIGMYGTRLERVIIRIHLLNDLRLLVYGQIVDPVVDGMATRTLHLIRVVHIVAVVQIARWIGALSEWIVLDKVQVLLLRSCLVRLLGCLVIFHLLVQILLSS